MANQPKKYKKFVATAATATLVASAIVPVASAAGFTDVENNTHKDAINALSDAGIINGYADGTFKPNQTINRGQVVKLLGRWLETEGFEVPSDWETSQRFKDLPLTAEKELVKYAALAKDAGVFAGSNGNLNYTQSMQRQQMAVVLVRAINEIYDLDLVAEYKEAGFKSEISDLGAAFSAEQREAITALEYAELTNAANLPGKAFKPADSITRGQFASFLYRTINLEIEEVADATVKAINNTTVEVTFDEEVGNIKDYDFKIEGLEVKNAAVKQTNKKVVVLTTAAQEVGKEYTVTLNGEEIGKFKGIEAVIPTSVTAFEYENPVVEGEIGKETTTQVKSHKSQQAPLGTQVTLKAQVTVAEGQSKAGIPVTFNIIDASNISTAYASLNQPILAEATTDENGVATYIYTRYASTSQGLITNDEVQVYATGKPTVRDFTKVYWANTQPLTITEVTTGNKLNNGAKKVYKVKLAGVNNAAELERPTGQRYINVGFLDNVNIAPDKANKNVTVTDSSGRNLGYPGQFTTTNSTETNRFNAVRVTLDANGEATFTLTGSNETVTPFVWQDNAVGNTNATVDRFDKTELAAFAPPVTFAKEQVLSVKVESLGTKNASAYKESFDNSGAYEYRSGNLVLVRDAVGNLTGADPANIPTGSVKINQNNPVGSQQVPAGFVYVPLNNAAVSGVAALENNNVKKTATLTGHLSKFSYTGTLKEKNDQMEQDLLNTGGRDYKVSYTDKDGKAAQSGQIVKVELKYGSAKTNANASATPIYFIDNNSHTVYKVSDFSKDTAEFSLQTDSKGQVAFTVIGGRDSYATPTAFVETGDKAGLDKNDAQQAGEIAYFGDRTISTAKLTINGEDTASKTVAEEVTFSYQSTDQNKKHYHDATKADYIATFQVTTGFGPATVTYRDRNGDLRTETLNQGSAKSYDVKSVNGKADLKVVSVRGNTVSVVASAHNLPILNASATFTTLNNEGIAYGQSVRGKVVAVDTTNNRILLTDAKGEKVYDLKYEADELYYKGTSGASEATFESYLTVGDELFFTQKADANGKAKFDNLDIRSGIKVDDAVRPNDRKTFIVEGDYTSTPKVYDFAKGADPADVVAGRTTVNADFQINGDNITLSNVNIIGNVTVGRTNATEAQILNDFALNNVQVTGTVTVNQGDGNTFVVTGNSQLNRVVLNIKEHVALANGSTINQLVVTQAASTLTGITAGTVLPPGVVAATGAGTVLEVTTTGNGTVTTATDVTAPTPTAEVPFTATTTSGDTVTLTFTAGTYAGTTDLAVTPGTIGTTTGDTVAINFANPVAGQSFEVKFTQNGVVKKFTVVAGALNKQATITRKY